MNFIENLKKKLQVKGDRYTISMVFPDEDEVDCFKKELFSLTLWCVYQWVGIQCTSKESRT